FFTDAATSQLYTLSLHDALPIWTGEDMITISIHDHFAAAHDHVQDDLIAAGMPGEHGFELLGDAGVAARNPHVDELAPRHRHAFRVVPKPRHIGDDRRRFDLRLDLRLDRRCRGPARPGAAGSRVHLALDHQHLVRLEQQP